MRLVLILPLLLVIACQSPPGAYHSRTEYVMGTLLEVRVEAADSVVAAAAVDTAFAAAHRLDRLLSNYDTTSELSRIGRAAPAAVTVSPLTLDFIMRSRDLAELTGGLLEFTIEPLVKLWGFYGDTPSIPDSFALARALEQVDYRRVRIDAEASTVQVDSGMALDPGAAGKGYALAIVDRALARLPLRSVYCDFGGQLFRRGAGLVEAAVRHPRSDSLLISVIGFEVGSLSTSGDWERYFEINGERFTHILDPRTGRPVRGVWGVSVWHPDPFIADALSTALFVIGPDSAETVLTSFPGAAALFVKPDGDSLIVHATAAWENMEEH